MQSDQVVADENRHNVGHERDGHAGGDERYAGCANRGDGRRTGLQAHEGEESGEAQRLEQHR